MFRRPYVLMCVVYTGIFTFAWSSFANLGALSRQRVQVWPFVLLLLAVPAVLVRPGRGAAPGRRATPEIPPRGLAASREAAPGTARAAWPDRSNGREL